MEISLHILSNTLQLPLIVIPFPLAAGSNQALSKRRRSTDLTPRPASSPTWQMAYSASSFWSEKFHKVDSVELIEFKQKSSSVIQFSQAESYLEYLLDYERHERVTRSDFLKVCNLFGPLSKLAQNVKSVCNMTCFLGRLTLDRSKKIFESEDANMTDGTYIVRIHSEWTGFEIDFVENRVIKTSHVKISDKGFTSGGPCFESLPQYIAYYENLHKRPYNRPFPRLSCFRWDMDKHAVHAFLKTCQPKEYIFRLSNNTPNSISMGYLTTSEKPTQHLISLSINNTYTAGNVTYTDFPSLLASSQFCELRPVSSPSRVLGMPTKDAQPLDTLPLESSVPTYTAVKRGAAADSPTTDPNLYLMTTQATSSNDKNAFPSKSEKWAIKKPKEVAPQSQIHKSISTNINSSFPSKSSAHTTVSPMTIEAYSDESQTSSYVAKPTGVAQSHQTNYSLKMVDHRTASTHNLPQQVPIDIAAKGYAEELSSFSVNRSNSTSGPNPNFTKKTTSISTLAAILPSQPQIVPDASAYMDSFPPSSSSSSSKGAPSQAAISNYMDSFPTSTQTNRNNSTQHVPIASTTSQSQPKPHPHIGSNSVQSAAITQLENNVLKQMRSMTPASIERLSNLVVDDPNIQTLICYITSAAQAYQGQ